MLKYQDGFLNFQTVFDLLFSVVETYSDSTYEHKTVRIASSLELDKVIAVGKTMTVSNFQTIFTIGSLDQHDKAEWLGIEPGEWESLTRFPYKEKFFKHLNS